MNDIWPLRLDAKNYSFRRNRDGIAWGLIVHPSADCIAVLAAMEPGFEVHITIEPVKETITQSGSVEEPKALPPKRRKTWAEMSAGERAVAESAMKADDPKFQLWASKKYGGGGVYRDTADFIRRRCGVKSRSEFATDEAARRRWEMLLAAYENDMGLRAEVR